MDLATNVGVLIMLRISLIRLLRDENLDTCIAAVRAFSGDCCVVWWIVLLLS